MKFDWLLRRCKNDDLRSEPLLPIPFARSRLFEHLGAITFCTFVDDDIICESFSVTEEIFLLHGGGREGMPKGGDEGARRTVLDLHANATASGSRFEDPMWWKSLSCLKPIGLNAMLTYAPSTAAAAEHKDDSTIGLSSMSSSFYSTGQQGQHHHHHHHNHHHPAHHLHHFDQHHGSQDGVDVTAAASPRATRATSISLTDLQTLTSPLGGVSTGSVPPLTTSLVRTSSFLNAQQQPQVQPYISSRSFLRAGLQHPILLQHPHPSAINFTPAAVRKSHTRNRTHSAGVIPTSRSLLQRSSMHRALVRHIRNTMPLETLR